jgi:hypothetical protein
MTSLRRRHVFASIGSCLAVVAALGSAAWQPASGTTQSRTQPTAWIAAAVPRYQHIFLIADVGHDFGAIHGNKFAPVINRLGRTYGLATHYFTTSDPDLANIVTLLAGDSFGVNDSFPYWDEQISQPSLLSQLTAAHRTWKAYYQGLPYPGYLGACYPVRCNGTPDADTFFTYKHLGVANFSYVVGNPAQLRNMVPATRIASDARTGHLPTFGLIIPDECRDMHGGPPWCEDGTSAYHLPNDNRLVAAADSYIGQVVREIMAGPQWRHGNNAIVITFTEGDTTAGCCGAKPGTGHVMTVVVTSHGPRHLSDPTPFNHYSLLATIQHAFGLGCLAHTCDTAHVAPMARLFGGTAAAAVLSHPWAAPKAGSGFRRIPRPVARAADARRVVSPWVKVPSPNVGANDNGLGAIAGRSPHDIWAVGNYLPAAHPDVTSTLAVHYNGLSWRAVRTPNVGGGQNTLLGVTVRPDGTAWAVGDYVPTTGGSSRALIEHWNGHRWSVVPSPDPGRRENLLYGVAATSDASAWAVGAFQGANGKFRTLIEHWNGRHWSVAASPDPGSTGNFLYSVTAQGRSVFASGQEFGSGPPDQQIIVKLTRTGWKVASVLSAGPGSSLSPFAIAASPAALWVAGSARSGIGGYQTLVEIVYPSAIGSLVTPNPTPRDNYLWAIAPIGAGGSAWAVGHDVDTSGNFESLIETGPAGGGLWTIVPSPSPGLANGGSTVLGGVVAFGPKDAWAVGYFDGKNARRTLILHFTGP